MNVISKDDTKIAYDNYGEGPVIIVVGGVKILRIVCI